MKILSYATSQGNGSAGFFIDFQEVANVCKNNSKKVFVLFCRLARRLYLWGYQIQQKQKAMSTKIVKFKKYATFFPPLPHLQTEIEIIYFAESEISYDENGEEEEITLLELAVFVNGIPAPFEWPLYNSSDGRKFLAFMREAARDALYFQESQKALEEMK